jgi:hypothetical protein
MFSKVRPVLCNGLAKFKKLPSLTFKLENFGSKKFNKPQSPNYFMCIRVNNDKVCYGYFFNIIGRFFQFNLNLFVFLNIKVIKAVEDCQNTILKTNPHLNNAAIKIPTLHITLFAMHLKDINQIDM